MTAKETAFKIQNVIFDALQRYVWNEARVEGVLGDFEAYVRADERVKATAEAYEHIGRVMVPRGSEES